MQEDEPTGGDQWSWSLAKTEANGGKDLLAAQGDSAVLRVPPVSLELGGGFSAGNGLSFVAEHACSELDRSLDSSETKTQFLSEGLPLVWKSGARNQTASTVAFVAELDVSLRGRWQLLEVGYSSQHVSRSYVSDVLEANLKFRPLPRKSGLSGASVLVFVFAAPNGEFGVFAQAVPKEN